LFDRPAFKTCVAHGIVLGNDGAKMSKSLRNYPDVNEVFDRDGSDAMRWVLMASPILRGGNLIVTEQGIREGVRQVQLPLWNAYSFLALYAPTVGTWRTDSTNVLDRYILAKLAALRDDLTAAMDVCDISGACELLRQFTEALTNWYVRRSRTRFWTEDRDAIDNQKIPDDECEVEGEEQDQVASAPIDTAAEDSDEEDEQDVAPVVAPTPVKKVVKKAAPVAVAPAAEEPVVLASASVEPAKKKVVKKKVVA
jgi:valyl-tRNA synthetase